MENLAALVPRLSGPLSGSTPPVGEELPVGGDGSAPLGTDVCAAPRVKAPSLVFLQPARGTEPVWEQGIEYTLSLRVEGEAVEAVTFTLADAKTYSSWRVSRGPARRCAARVGREARDTSAWPRCVLRRRQLTRHVPGRWSETLIAKAAAVEDGFVRVTWRVPRDQPVSDSYVLTARTVPAGLAEAQARGRGARCVETQRLRALTRLVRRS